MDEPASALLLLLSEYVFAKDKGVLELKQGWFDNPPPEVETRADIPYLGEGRAERLDLYLPRNRAAGTHSVK